MISLLKLAYKAFVATFPSIITVALIDAYIIRLPGNTGIIPFLLLTLMYTWIFYTLENKFPIRFTDKDREEHRRLQREAQLELLEAEFNNWKIYNKQPLDTNRDFPGYQRLEKLREEFRGGFYYDD